jgi:hypothetical protein
LCCDKEFNSTGPGNRICPQCRNSQDVERRPSVPVTVGDRVEF